MPQIRYAFATIVCAAIVLLFATVVAAAVSSHAPFADAAPSEGDSSRCMKTFNASSLGPFEKCKDHICFMFLSEEPYIALPLNMTQNLFTCTDRTKAFPSLKGIIFDIFDEIHVSSGDLLRDVQCIWAGSECLFNDLVAFLNEYGPNYKFAIIGMLLEVSNRMTPNLFPSTSLFDDKMVVVGKIDNQGPLDTIKRPFRQEAWILFGIMLAVFVAFGALVVWVFSPDSFSFINMALHFLGDYPEGGDTDEQSQLTALPGDSTSSAINIPGDSTTTVSGASEPETASGRPQSRPVLPDDVTRSREALYRSAVLLWRIALSAFLVILLLFYEVAVVNFLFIEQSSPQGVRVTKLGRQQLHKYAVLKNSALEDVWSRTVDPYGVFNSSNFPWYRCSTESECFEQLANPTKKRVQYAVTFDSFARYELKKTKQCDRLTVYSAERRLYTFGAGWLYGRNVSSDVRRVIDKKILDLRVTDKMREVVERTTKGKEGRCEEDSGDIGAQIVILPLGILVGPCLIGLMIVLCLSWRRRASSGTDTDIQPPDNDEFEQPTLAENRGNYSSLSESQQRQVIHEVVMRRRRPH